MKLVIPPAPVDPAAALETALWDGETIRTEVIEALSGCIPVHFRGEFVHEILDMIRDLQQRRRSRSEIATEVLFETYGEDYEPDGSSLPLRVPAVRAGNKEREDAPDGQSDQVAPHDQARPAMEQIRAIRAKVSDRLGVGRYRTWFGDSTELTLDRDRLGVYVENPFVSRWIADNYMSDLVDATRDVIGVEPHVEIQVAPRPKAVEEPAPNPASRLTAREPAYCPPTLRGDLGTLVVGPPNQLAYCAATSLVQRPGEGTRLLVLHGGCGLGKTHFLQGICNGVRRTHPRLECRYTTGEEFTNQFVAAVQARRVDLFRARFRKVDVLVIDDMHYLANKRATLEEFLHTLNAVDAGGRAIVLSTDRHPRSVATLSEPLINRLVAGMVVQIDPPDFSMRCEILRRRAAGMRVSLPDEVLDFVARRVTRNVRALEGALYRLAAMASLAKQPIDLKLARLSIEDYADTAARPPDPTDIECVVSHYFGVSRERIRSKDRDRTACMARGLAMYLIRRHTHMSYPDIGRALGHKNHSTVLMSVRRMEMLLDRNGAISWTTQAGVQNAPARALVESLEDAIRSGSDHALIPNSDVDKANSGSCPPASGDPAKSSAYELTDPAIAEIRRQVADGTYLTPDKMEAVIDGLDRAISDRGGTKRSVG